LSRHLIAALGAAAALTVASLGAVPAATAATASSEISGIVHDPSGKPVSNLSLYVVGPGGMTTGVSTDDAGRYDMTQLSAGSYELNVPSPPNITPVPAAVMNRPLSLAAGQHLTADVDLRVGAVISGTVTSAAGVPENGVTVTLSATNGVSPQAVTDATGHYTLAGVPTGTFRLVFATRGTVPQLTFATAPVVVTSPGQSLVFNQRLDPTWVYIHVARPQIKKKGHYLEATLNPAVLIKKISWSYKGAGSAGFTKVGHHKRLRIKKGWKGTIRLRVTFKSEAIDPQRGLHYAVTNSTRQYKVRKTIK